MTDPKNTFIGNSVLAALSEVTDRPVELNDGSVPLGHFPLMHVLVLAIGASGNVNDVVARLEADGWKPSEVLANAYPDLAAGKDEA